VSKVEEENMVDLFNGDEIERRGGQEGLTPLVRVWSQCKGELPQGMQEARADGQASVALAWVWSQYRGEFPQSAGERNAISKADARASTMSGKEPSDALPSIRSDPGGSASKASTPFILKTAVGPFLMG